MAKFTLEANFDLEPVEMWDDIKRQLYIVYIEEVREMTNRYYDIKKSLYVNNWDFYEDLKRDYPTIFEGLERLDMTFRRIGPDGEIDEDFDEELERRKEGVKKFKRILHQINQELNLNGGAWYFLHQQEKLLRGIYDELAIRYAQGERGVVIVERDNFRGSLRANI